MFKYIPPPTMHTSTSSDSRSSVRGSNSPFSSVKRRDSDCEKARVCVVNNAGRVAKRRPEDVKVLAGRRTGATVETGVARENRRDRTSRLKRGKTAPFEAIVSMYGEVEGEDQYF